jgi:hypothetical protein
MEAIGGQKNKRISCIPQNLEKYISFSLGAMVFLDSLQFLGASLEQLVANLSAEGQEKFPNMHSYILSKFPQLPQDTIKLLLQKGVYPYDHMDSQKKFEDTCLPPKEAFFNILSEEPLSDQDYEHAQKVWKTFEMNNMGQYHDLYMETGMQGFFHSRLLMPFS